MAHTKAKGSTKLGRDSQSKRLGLKVGSGQQVIGGQILIRQRGTKYLAGANVGIGKDDTLFSKTKGKVKFTNQKHQSTYQFKKFRTVVAVDQS